MKKINYLKEKCRELGGPLTSEELELVKKDYPNLSILQENILKMEAQVAQSISWFHEKSNRINAHPIPQLDYDLEWFLTWRAKLGRFPHTVWCDGVEVTQYEKINEQLYKIKARIWLGPESDVGLTFNCEMQATIELEPSLEQLCDYQIQIDYQGQKYFICKEI